MKINNILIFVLLITLFIFFARIYKEGFTADEIKAAAVYNANVDKKNAVTGNISELISNLNKKDYSIYVSETSAMATQQWNLFIILSIVTLGVLLFTLRYVFF